MDRISGRFSRKEKEGASLRTHTPPDSVAPCGARFNRRWSFHPPPPVYCFGRYFAFSAGDTEGEVATKLIAALGSRRDQ